MATAIGRGDMELPSKNSIATAPTRAGTNVDVEGVDDSDANLLRALGQTPQLKRVHTFWTLMAYQTTILCSWSCNIVMYTYVFEVGGPVCLVWGTLVVTIGQVFVMASLAEYCGIWPTAGGQQFYVQQVAPPSLRRFLSYVVGWCVLVGEISTSASCALNSAQIVGAFVVIAHPQVLWKPWMTWLVYTAFLIGPVASNLAPRSLPALNVFAAFFNVSSGLTWAIVFLVLAPKYPASFVFTHFINETGWASNGWVFVLSMYVPIYGLYGTDGVMHLVEEMRHPSRDAPKVIIYSFLWAGVTAFLSAIVMLYTAGNYEMYLNFPQPYLAWFMDITHSLGGGGTFCAVIMLGLNYFIIVNMNTAGSRLAWSMARDGAFPKLLGLEKVSDRFGMPMRALTAFLLVNLAIGLLVLATDLAFYAIISGGGVALQVAYCAPILCVVLRSFSSSSGTVLPPRPYFDLGRWRLPFNVTSLAWSIIVILFYLFPQYVPVGGSAGTANMNWAVVVLGGVVLAAGGYWIVKGRKEYLIERLVDGERLNRAGDRNELENRVKGSVG